MTIFKAQGKTWRLDPFKNVKSKTGKAKGEYSKSNKWLCSGTKCHPQKAFGFCTVTQVLDNGEKGKAMNRCANCLTKQFGECRDKNGKLISGNVGRVIQDEETQIKNVGPEEVNIIVTNGSEQFLHDLHDNNESTNKDHARVAVRYMQHMIKYSRRRTRPATDEEILRSVENLKQKGLFADTFGSRVSTGYTGWNRARELLVQEPVFRGLIEEIEENFVIADGFCHAGVQSLDGIQDYHNDKFKHPKVTHRSVYQISGKGCRKTMTIIDRKGGRHVSFLVPHGSVVHLSKEGAGADNTHDLQHRIDGGVGTFAIILETYPRPTRERPQDS